MKEALTDILLDGQSAFNFWIVTSKPVGLPHGIVALDIENDRLYYRRPSNNKLRRVKLSAKNTSG